MRHCYFRNGALSSALIVAGRPGSYLSPRHQPEENSMSRLNVPATVEAAPEATRPGNTVAKTDLDFPAVR
jgi:hypothetical protein